ncbi:MAG: hypothetical protein HY860_03920 [Chlamydiales bacterium]|nr:hypothetical protein [Chlamydiales bacterium]
MDKFFLAAVFGPLMIIFSLARLCSHERTAVLESIRQGPALIWIISILNLFFGLLIINTYHVWTATLAVLVPLLGWFFIVRGFLLLFLHKKMLRIFLENPRVNFVSSVIGIVWGIALTIFAHF